MCPLLSVLQPIFRRPSRQTLATRAHKSLTPCHDCSLGDSGLDLCDQPRPISSGRWRSTLAQMFGSKMSNSNRKLGAFIPDPSANSDVFTPVMICAIWPDAPM